MFGLFGGNGNKEAEEAAARAEFERLTTQPRPALAAEVMQAFGPGGPRGRGSENEINILQILGWMQSSRPRFGSYLRQLDGPVRESLQLLEHAGLVMHVTKTTALRTRATDLGRAALADGTVERCLQGSATRPAAAG